jgi:hypothetical protein
MPIADLAGAVRSWALSQTWLGPLRDTIASAPTWAIIALFPALALVVLALLMLLRPRHAPRSHDQLVEPAATFSAAEQRRTEDSLISRDSEPVHEEVVRDGEPEEPAAPLDDAIEPMSPSETTDDDAAAPFGRGR